MFKIDVLPQTVHFHFAQMENSLETLQLFASELESYRQNHGGDFDHSEYHVM